MSQTRWPRAVLALVILILASTTTNRAQQASVSADRLVQMPQLVAGRSGDASGTELTVRWGEPGNPPPGPVVPNDGRPVPRNFELVSQRPVTGLPSLERDPQ